MAVSNCDTLSLNMDHGCIRATEALQAIRCCEKALEGGPQTGDMAAIEELLTIKREHGWRSRIDGRHDMWNFLIPTVAAAILVLLGLIEAGAEVWVF